MLIIFILLRNDDLNVYQASETLCAHPLPDKSLIIWSLD